MCWSTLAQCADLMPAGASSLSLQDIPLGTSLSCAKSSRRGRWSGVRAFRVYVQIRAPNVSISNAPKLRWSARQPSVRVRRVPTNHATIAVVLAEIQHYQLVVLSKSKIHGCQPDGLGKLALEQDSLVNLAPEQDSLVNLALGRQLCGEQDSLVNPAREQDSRESKIHYDIHTIDGFK